MKKLFAITKNVKRFYAAVKEITSSPAGIDRMCLSFGDPGLGKSEAAIRWVNDVDRLNNLPLHSKSKEPS